MLPVTPPRALVGNFWTLYRHAARLSLQEPPAEELETTIEDVKVGAVRVRSRLSMAPGYGKPLLVCIHGLGGSADSGYMRQAVAHAHAVGANCLRVTMRGADGSGEDLYHAGLGSDLDAILAHSRLRGIKKIYVLGFSLGGHVALSHALSPLDSRVRATAAVCSPVFLEHCQQAFDAQASVLYKRHILGSLKEMYFELVRRGRGTVPYHQIFGMTTIRQWDEQVVAPRHGFLTASDYYQSVSVGQKLHRLQVPSLLLIGQEDPVVIPSASVPKDKTAKLSVQRLRGGHLGFPPDTRISGVQTDEKDVVRQTMKWLMSF